MHLPIPTPHHAVPDQKPTRSPRPKPRLQQALTWRLESVIAGYDFEKREIHRDIIWTYPRMEEPRGKMPRRVETSESAVPFHSSEGSSSEIQQTSTAAASGNPTGKRLYLSTTEGGPPGNNKMTMQRDRHGRWMPTKGERTMNTQKSKGRETKILRRKPATWNLFDCVGRGEDTAWRILPQSTERRCGILETPFCRRANAIFESNRNRMARSTRFQGSDHHRFHASGCDQRKTQ